MKCFRVVGCQVMVIFINNRRVKQVIFGEFREREGGTSELWF